MSIISNFVFPYSATSQDLKQHFLTKFQKIGPCYVLGSKKTGPYRDSLVIQKENQGWEMHPSLMLPQRVLHILALPQRALHILALPENHSRTMVVSTVPAQVFDHSGLPEVGSHLGR